ncbi:MAG: D-hexose-6-phosphate mutarotase [Candidatus Parabeggiatoa sp. nov. 3]|nr:MAG: D-hexose-6-phosphate mutarotase [Gammaproteobacteria bacterium]RKZ67947.1 MAG: D-hexose-6-phosphate mutarotase [Gammaproteobacteria bacterium]RKZ84093.1 MAG: D-hexose-6-phosphate mutarotase [Gammaproteobacteria bacterium]
MYTLDLKTFKNRLTDLQNLNERFAIDHHLELKAGYDGTPVIDIKNDYAQSIISLKGGQVMTFRPHHDPNPVLWLSGLASLNPNKPIRGGIPVCWPWFGHHLSDPNKPAHGFARTIVWTLSETKVTAEGATQIVLSLENHDNIRALWPYAFQLETVITIGADLQVELVTRNTGNETFTLGEALHSYFNVSEVTQISIHGLENSQYIDTVAQLEGEPETGPIQINAEMDRVYPNSTADCLLQDIGFNRQIRIQKTGSQTTVVWNPWIEKAARLGDLGYQNYLRMVCIESANAANNIVTVAPSEEHRLQTVITVEGLSPFPSNYNS